MVSIEALRVPPGVKMPSKTKLRDEAVEGKTQREDQKALNAPAVSLNSLAKEFSGSSKNEDIANISSAVSELISEPETSKAINSFFKEGDGASFVTDVEKRIAAHDLSGLTDVTCNNMLVQNYNTRNNLEKQNAIIGSLATGRRMNRVAGIQERTPGSPVAGFKDTLGPEDARNEDLRKELPLLPDKYYAAAATSKAATLIADILRTFEDKKLKPEEKYTRAESLLEEFKKDPSKYMSKLSSGGPGAGGGAASTQTQQGQRTQTQTQTATQAVQLTTPQMQALQIAEGTVFRGVIEREFTNLKIVLSKIHSPAQIDDINEANTLNKLLFLEAHLHMKNIDEANRRAIADRLKEANEMMKEALKRVNDEAEKTGGKKWQLVMEDISRITESKDFKRIYSLLGTMLDQMDAMLKKEYELWAAFMMSLGLPPDDFYMKINDSYLLLREAQRRVEEEKGKVEIPDSAVTLEFEQ
jgi:hypothetical protein